MKKLWLRTKSREYQIIRGPPDTHIREMAKERFLRSRRQKLLPTHLQSYSWLVADDQDMYGGYCSYCNCHLSIKRCDLSKHERTMKHRENEVIKMACNELVRTQPPVSPCGQQLEDGTHELIQYVNFQVGPNNESSNGSEIEKENNSDIENGESSTDSRELHSEDNEEDLKHNGLKNYVPWYPCLKSKETQVLLPRIKLTKKTLSPTSSYAAKNEGLAQATQVSSQVSRPVENISSPTQRAVPSDDSLELFFNSICASVKALPPKLAIEGKKRVIEVVAELEMRALNERQHEAEQ